MVGNPDIFVRSSSGVSVDYNFRRLNKIVLNSSSHRNPKLTDCIVHHSERTLFRCDDGRSISYGSALDLSQRPAFRETYRRLVLCFCDNEASSLLGYLALMACDAVPLLVGSSLSVAQLQKLLQTYQPDFVWLPDSRLSEISEGRSVLSFGGYSLMASGYDREYTIDNSLALLLSTSGSTGSPKFVRLSHENLMSNAMAISQYLELTPYTRLKVLHKVKSSTQG